MRGRIYSRTELRHWTVPGSIIYLGNYTEAGSTPVVREPQIIERKLSGVSAGDGVPANRTTAGSLNAFYRAVSSSFDGDAQGRWAARCHQHRLQPGITRGT